jgi:hypothetical protein
MSPAQLTKYRAEWAKCRVALKAAGKAHDDRARFALHERAIGRRCSSKDFSQREFDMVLAAMAAISRPADFAAQMRQQDQPDLRRSDVECRISDALVVIIPGEPADSEDFLRHRRERYRQGLVRRMFGTNITTDRQLQQLMGVLERQAGKKEKPVPADNQPF